MSFLEKAHEIIATHDFKIFPVVPRGKTPLVKDWPNQATTDGSTVDMWWSRWPNANIGVATGSKSRVWVLDIDAKSGGLESLERLRSEVLDWPETLVARTGGGGLHFYFRHDPVRPVGNTVGKIAPGIDTRGEGGYVVAPPSIHASGISYEWIG